MSIITTKQLRDDMARVVNDLKNGKSVQLSYRHKIIGVLQPVEEKTKVLRRGSSEAVRRYLNTNKFVSMTDNLIGSPKNFKQEIAELRDRDISKK